ncbi:MAG: type II secretion system F family protein [Treponema sp.]|uniref:type II secretion system F family protein n=1 Tax=Treponema sp. TaxID=166 RepID=UPI0025F70909|nr:type II secretion system F family protein [Treponema sp.]MBR0496323.1 type II secretion system F family protein [Treponema sp.]
MNGFFDFLSRKKRLACFTERLSELVSSGISIQKSLEILGRISSTDRKLAEFCSSVGKSLCGGTKFSVAVSMSPLVKAPSWYISYISVAEECGAVAEVLLHLKKLLLHESESLEKFVSAVAYPFFVVILTAVSGFFSVKLLLPEFSGLFGGDGKTAAEIQSEAMSAMIYADFVLLAVFILFVWLSLRILRASPCLSVLKTMDFLSRHSLPTLSAVNCAFAFSEKDRKIAFALLSVRNELLEGAKIASCFGKCFSDAGFKKEGLLLSENLSLCEQTGRNDGFKNTADYISAKNERTEKIFLASVQPLLLFFAAAYMTLILKTAFLPYITNIGGII